MSAADLYDFESILPLAVQTVLKEAGLNAFTIVDDASFQRARPYVSIVYRHIGEHTPRRIAVLPDGSKRGSAFTGELKIHAITDADAPGKIAHSQYRATVRSVMAGLQDVVNGNSLQFHKIQWLQPGNEETGIRTQDGYQQTTFPFQVVISIQQDAWAQLS